MENIISNLKWLASWDPRYVFVTNIVNRLTAGMADDDGRNAADAQAVGEILLANKLISLPHGYRLALSLYYSGGLSIGVTAKVALLSRVHSGYIPSVNMDALDFGGEGDYATPAHRYRIRALVAAEAAANDIILAPATKNFLGL